MPLKGNVRYRWKTYPSGKKVRLAFRGKGKVIEVKKKGGVAKRIDGRGLGNKHGD